MPLLPFYLRLQAIVCLLSFASCITIQSKPENSSSAISVTERKQSPSTDSVDSQLAVYLSSGNQFARDGLLREAMESYRKALAIDSSHSVALRNLGIVYVKAGDFGAAIINLEKCIASFDRNFDANYYLAEAYRATDKYADAIFRYKMALTIQKDDLRALKSLAWSYHKTRFYSEALSVAQKALTISPNDDQIPIIVARVLMKLKRENDALNILRKYSVKAPSSSAPYFQSVEAEILYSKGDSVGAQTVFRAALKSQPMLAGALFGLGKISLEQGKTQEAIDYMERAVRIKPKMFEGHYFLGKALEKTNPQKALRHLNYFRKNSATDPELIDMVSDAKDRILSLAKTKEKIGEITE